MEIRRVCLLIVGSHRSGTSALTRILSIQGCNLPETVLGPNFGNEDGHWESEVIKAFNDQLLDSAGSRWDDIQPIGDGWYASPSLAHHLEKARGLLASEFGESPLFVLKDPRICRLVPFWLEALRTSGIEPAIVLPLRSPAQVGDSLERRDETPNWYGQLIWLRNVLDAEQATRGHNRVFSSFDRLRRDWRGQIDAIANGLGLQLPRVSLISASEADLFIKPADAHQVGDGTISNELSNRPEVTSWINDTFLICSRWAREGEKEEDFEALDRIRSEFDQSSRALGAFLLPTAIAGEPGRGARRRQELQEQLTAREQEISALREQLRSGAIGEGEMPQNSFEPDDESALSGVRLRRHAGETDEGLNEFDLLRLAVAEERGRRAEIEKERDKLAANEHSVATGIAQIIATHDASPAALAAFALQIGNEWSEVNHPLAALAGALARSNTAISEQKQGLHEDIASLVERVDQYERAARELDHRDSASRELIASLRHEVDGYQEAAAQALQQLHTVNVDREAQIHGLEAGLARKEREATWLRQLHQQLEREQSAWNALRTRRARRQRLSRRLRNAGLFDADAYLARYPDIKEAGMDPLEHYVFHGIAEGRVID